MIGLPLVIVYFGKPTAVFGIWLKFFEQSGTTQFHPCVLTDRESKLYLDNYKVTVRAAGSCTPTPPAPHILHKADWLKAQAYGVFGRCVVMDMDAVAVASLDSLTELHCDFAMAENAYERVYKRWPHIGPERSAGLMYMDSPWIWDYYKRFWSDSKYQIGKTPKTEYEKPWTFGQVCLTAVLHEFARRSPERAQVLDARWNWPIMRRRRPPADVKIVHAGGGTEETKIRRLKQIAQHYNVRYQDQSLAPTYTREIPRTIGRTRKL